MVFDSGAKKQPGCGKIETIDMMTLTEIKKLLAEHGASPRKGLGQNFLFESAAIRNIVAAGNIRHGDTVLEIGPGIGNLTVNLAVPAKRVVAVEKDPVMVEILKTSLAGIGNVTIINEDILRFDETALPASYKIVANLPFYLTAPAIRKFLESESPPEMMALVIQKEVAQRICAAPPAMSLLAVSVQFYADPAIIGYISKKSFWPAPNVDCAIIKITPRRIPKDKNFAAEFFKVAKAGFSHPRKQLANNFAATFKLGRAKTEQWLESAAIQPARRAETLTVEEWESLARSLDSPAKKIL